VLDLAEGDEPIWTAFWTLARGRTYGGGMMAIPNPLAYSEIVAYARTTGMDVEDTVVLVQEMDTVFLKHHTDRAERARQVQAAKQEAEKKPK